MSDLRVQQIPLPSKPTGGTVDEAAPVATEAASQQGRLGQAGSASSAGPVGADSVQGCEHALAVHEGKFSGTLPAPRRSEETIVASPRLHPARRADRGGAAVGGEADQRERLNFSPPGGEAIRLEIGQEVIPRLSSAVPLNQSSLESTTLLQLSSQRESSLLLMPRSSTPLPPSRECSRRRSRSSPAEARAERNAIEAEARQALARAQSTLFPELVVDPPITTETGGDRATRGRRGWLAGSHNPRMVEPSSHGPRDA